MSLRQENWWISSIVLRQVELPRDAEAVGDPGEQPAESVVVGRHQNLAPIGELFRQRSQLGLVVALDEGRGRGREAERMYRRAVVEHDFESADANAGHRDLPLLRPR